MLYHHGRRKRQNILKIDGIINAERNPMSRESEFCELFLKWAEKINYSLRAIGAYREEEEVNLLRRVKVLALMELAFHFEL